MGTCIFYIDVLDQGQRAEGLTLSFKRAFRRKARYSGRALRVKSPMFHYAELNLTNGWFVGDKIHMGLA